MKSTLTCLIVLFLFSNLLWIVLAVTLDQAYKSNQGNELSTSTTPTTAMSTIPGSTTKEPTEPWEKNYRLPTDTLPLHYEIYLHPNLVTGTFSGSVDIHLSITAPRDFILVHTKFLNITSSTLRQGLEGNGEVIALGETFEYEPNEFWVVKLRNQITPNNYTLTLKFDGSLTKSITGFYKSDYFDSITQTNRYDLFLFFFNFNLI